MTNTFILIFQTFILASLLRIYLDIIDIKNAVEVKTAWENLGASMRKAKKTVDDIEEDRDIKGTDAENYTATEIIETNG